MDGVDELGEILISQCKVAILNAIARQRRTDVAGTLSFAGGRPMTSVDFGIVAMITISGLLAFRRGLTRELLGLAAWTGAATLAFSSLPLVRPYLAQWMQGSQLFDPVTFIALFVVLLVILTIIAHLLGGAVRSSMVGGLDRTLGLGFGLARGIVLVMAVYLLGGMVVEPQDWPVAARNALFRPLICDGAAMAVHELPDDKDSGGRYIFRPNLYRCELGSLATAEVPLQSSPIGSATGRHIRRSSRD